MIWYIEYFCGKLISETDVSFFEIDKRKIKNIYFKNTKGSCFGFNTEKNIFFVNNKYYDFKLNGAIQEISQYKTASFNIEKNKTNILCWNLCVELKNEEYYEKYIMSIDIYEAVILKAIKQNLNSIVIGEKSIALR